MPSESSPSCSRSSSFSSPPPTPPNMHHNAIDSDARWIVQKFGGTSVGKFAAKIAEDIVLKYIDQHKVAIVCSARSDSTKALGTTNLLLRAASEALRSSKPNTSIPSTPTCKTGPRLRNSDASYHSPSRSISSRSPSPASGQVNGFTPFFEHSNEPAFFVTVDLIRQQHLDAARDSIADPNILQDLERDIDRDCDWLKNFLLAAKIVDEISPRSRDSIIGLGEKMACRIMTAILRDRDIDAEYVSLEDIVPPYESDTAADHTLSQDFYDSVAQAFGERIQDCGSRVPVVTGFFGPVPGSLLRQVGRGYTDLCSALLAVGTQASELQIWKEVDGIFTADPRKVCTARLLSAISPEEAAELTYYGSEVVHPFTMEQVIRKSIPIRIKNVENPRGAGTVIHPNTEERLSSSATIAHSVPEPVTFKSLHELAMATEVSQRKKLPTAVTIKENIVIFNIKSNRKSVSHGFLAGTFSTLDKFGVVVDLISTSEVHVSMAIHDYLPKKNFERLVRDLKQHGSVDIHRDMAILSLVGKEMKNMVGIAGRMFTTLAQGNINIEMISQGASEINISCVIQAQDAIKALNLIHQSCLQIKPEGARGGVGPWLF